MEPNWETVTKDGWRHRENPEELIQYFFQLTKDFPLSARAKFELANAYDYLGEEEKSIPYYEQAIRSGLSREYESYAMLQLGSSLRNADRLQEAEKILADAEKKFPEMPSIQCFCHWFYSI
jgi:tetratricopeptide (TPR) repeat protein